MCGNNSGTLTYFLVGEATFLIISDAHIYKVYGTTSGFGPYDSLVCPWMENGSVSRYMEKWGDIMSMTDRLQLVSFQMS